MGASVSTSVGGRAHELEISFSACNKSPRNIIKNLDDLLSTRFKGAVNIRGIRYQLLYSLLRVFDLYNVTTCDGT